MKLCDIHFVSWNRPKITELAIRTIRRNSKPQNYRLVVLDQGSHEEQQEMLRHMKQEGLIDELIIWRKNEGLEYARTWLLNNRTESTYFICADNDCLPMPVDKHGIDWIERLVKLMEVEREYGAISCRTQVMIGTGNIFDGMEDQLVVEFPWPGGSLRIMRTDLVKSIGGWEGKPGRGSEERYICAKIQEKGFKTGFAVQIPTLHLFGPPDTDNWGYDKDMSPEDSGHSPDVWHPIFGSGDDYDEVKKFAGEENAKNYFGIEA